MTKNFMVEIPENKIIRDIADQMYSKLSGADNNNEYESTVRDLYCWLADGDLTPTELEALSIDNLVEQWLDF